MNPQTKTSAKDFFLNLGAIVALYTIVVSLLNLLFTVINKAYPQITTNYYSIVSSQSISWPVAMLIIFFPIFILLMWLLERGYVAEPEKRHLPVKKWLTYITLFIAGLTLAIDLVTILYYFIDGQELTMAFIMKILVVFIVVLCVFLYYISEIREKMTGAGRKIWFIVALVIILASIIWGFAVLGSPMTQRLYKYDEQKVNDLMNISSAVQNYYSTYQILPSSLSTIPPDYYISLVDPQTQKPYKYELVQNLRYKLCAEFNKSSPNLDNPNSGSRPVLYKGASLWDHPAGEYCFEEGVNSNPYAKPVPAQ